MKKWLSKQLARLAWILSSRPKMMAMPTYLNGKLVGYEEFKLNEIGLAYIEIGKLRRYMSLFNTTLTSEGT